MSKHSSDRTNDLIVLISYTFAAIALSVNILLLGKENWMAIQLAVELVICWIIHISAKAQAAEKWLYLILGMYGLAFYGLHSYALLSLAPIVICFMALYYAVERYNFIPICAAVYFASLAANLILHINSTEFSALTIAGLIVESAAVLLAAYLIKLLNEKRAGRINQTQEIIASLKEENRRTEDFLTNVSHELRTPINAVTGLSAILLKNELDNEKRDSLLSIQRAGYRLFGQIEDILDYTETDGGRVTVSEENYMLASLINDIISELNISGKKDGIELIFDIDARIPAVLIGDSKKIKKIIRHLIDNAIKFTEEGGVYVRLYALRKPYGINLCIQVKDTGIGMDAQSLSKITERFYQSSAGRDRRNGGLGLGLPIVYGMTAAMEGFVHIESAVGKGTEATVSIPQKIASDEPGMKVNDPAELCLACYLKPEKYKLPQVRKFYDGMISNIALGLDIAVHRVFNRTELETLVKMYRLTHLFLAKEEYGEDPDYFESLDNSIQVVVIADDGYTPKEGSRVKVLYKPFYCFPVVNILNSAPSGEYGGQERMICPDVRALIVDDEPMNRVVAEGILKDYRMQVKTAGGGAEAIAICENEDFDIIFLDHMMPDMDGVETLKRLRGLKSDSFTAIAFTANAVSGAREMFLQEGFDDFLSKPIEYHDLDRLLKKVIPNTRMLLIKEEAAPDTSAPSGDDPLAALNEAGINTSAGLSYCRNDKEFYIKLLQKFVSDADGKIAECDRLFGENDIANYRIQVHALKSTAKMLGADALSDNAKAMENAAKDNDAEYIASHHRQLMEELSDTAHKIQGIALAGEDNDEQERTSEISAEELVERLTALRELFDTYEADKAHTLIDKLGGTSVGGVSVKKLLAPIKSDVEDYEYEAAAQKTSLLIARAKGGVL